MALRECVELKMIILHLSLTQIRSIGKAFKAEKHAPLKKFKVGGFTHPPPFA